MSAIADFPLIWRWTSAIHALFSESGLAGLHPCSPAEAAELHDASLRFLVADSLDPKQFDRVLTQSANLPLADGCSWLRAQAPNLAERVAVSWQRDTALRTTWEHFTARWDDFCYPSSDDVLVLPDSGSWIFLYHHAETFSFGNRDA